MAHRATPTPGVDLVLQRHQRGKSCSTLRDRRDALILVSVCVLVDHTSCKLASTPLKKIARRNMACQASLIQPKVINYTPVFERNVFAHGQAFEPDLALNEINPDRNQDRNLSTLRSDAVLLRLGTPRVQGGIH